MHIKEHVQRWTRTAEGHLHGGDAHEASCSCGEWQHGRLVDPGNPLDRAEVEDAWFEHANPGVRL